MCEVEEERFVLVALKKLDRFFGISASELIELRGVFDNFVVSKKSGVPPFLFWIQARRGVLWGIFVRLHVVRVAQPEPVIEAASARQILRFVTEMPFADALRHVSVRLQRLRDCDFVLGKSTFGSAHDDALLDSTGHAAAYGQIAQ